MNSDTHLEAAFPDTCAWITDRWHSDSAPALNRYYAFRQVVSLPAGRRIRRAFLRITANARYLLWINGRPVGRGPIRGYPHHLSFDEADITDRLVPGANHLAVLVHHPGRSTGQFVCERGAGLLCYGEVILDDEQVVRIRTDRTWKAREAAWYRPDPAMISVQIGFQEHYDARLEPSGWRTCGLADLKDWRGALPLGPPHMPPYRELSRRDIPVLREDRVAPAEIVYQGVFEPPEGAIPHENLRLKFESARLTPAGDIARAEGDGWYVLSPPERGAALLTLDLGRTMTIRPAVEVVGDEVERVELYYNAYLSDDGRPGCGSGLTRDDEGEADSFVPTESCRTFETFGVRGFRFVSAAVYGRTGGRVRILPRRVEYPVQLQELDCDGEWVRRFHEVSHRSLQTCMLDAFVDCCCREQALWGFDACVQGEAAFWLYGETALLRRSLRVVADSLLPEGYLRNMGPAAPSFMIMIDQNLEWVESCWFYALHSGDMDFLREVEPATWAFLSMCERNLTSENLLIPPPGTWHWNDWANLDRRPYSLLVNARLFAAVCAAEHIAEHARSERLETLCRGIRRRLRTSLPRFYDDTAGAFIEHVDVGDGVANPRADEDLCPPGFPADFSYHSQQRFSAHSNAVMLRNRLAEPNLFPADVAKRVLDSLVRMLRETLDAAEAGRPADYFFGPGWTEKIIGPLLDYGRDAEALELLKRLGRFFLRDGAPTWPEGFAAGKYNTAHGWGAAISTVLVKYLLGVRPVEPGFAQFSLDPRAGTLERCGGRVRTARGWADVRWTRQGNRQCVELDLPDGVTCVLPDGERIDGPGRKTVSLSPGGNSPVW